MSDAPKRIRPLEATGADGNGHYTWRTPMRYVLAEGPEFEALIERARTTVANAEETQFEQAFLDYFEESGNG